MKFKDIPQFVKEGSYQVNVPLRDLLDTIRKWQEDYYYQLQLNPEFQRSIQNGTFINLNPVGKMKSSPSKVPFTKDFSEYIKLDKSVLVEEKKNWKDMPPQAAMREPIEVKEPDLKVNPLVYTIPGQVKQTAVKPSGHDFNDFLSYLC